MQTIIVRPVITEKSMKLAGKSKYTFLVARTAKKDAIKKTVEKMFGVHVTDISTVITKGKSQTVGKRRTRKEISPSKKAVITLRIGEKIALFEQQS